HFSLGVANMHEAMELLEQRGWQSTAREQARIGRDGKWQLNLHDPSGTRVELMEFRLVEVPCCSPYTLPAPQ
ncbi:MAG: glyoxalase, partial [Acidobacteriaceae bacterium]